MDVSIKILLVKKLSLELKFNSWIDEKDIVEILYKMSQYFPKPYERSDRNGKVKLNLSDLSCQHKT